MTKCKVMFPERRDSLIREIRQEVAETAGYTGRSRLSETTYQAMQQVNRESFVSEDMLEYAWGNYPLSIGFNQTISQPYIVALMSDLLDLKPSDKVLEIGTGSGYQMAILSYLAKQIYSIETVPELYEQALGKVKEQSLDNVELKLANGYEGWPEYAPFDAIIVTAAPHDIPQCLLDQLAPGGRMVIPVGSAAFGQNLKRIKKFPDETLDTKDVLPVSFVPMVG